MSRLVLSSSVLWLVLITLSFSWNYRDAQQEQQEIALQAARSFFQQILITRTWNASHGGVYVPVTETTQPNPHLNIPVRDIRINSQLTLTKVNPAFMTRQIAELTSAEQRDIQIHITSLNPLRPENQATAREAKALIAFDGGLAEYSEIIRTVNPQTFFYMAPLTTEESCLQCHAQQGYKVGDIRGGISVTLPFTAHKGFIPLLIGHLVIALTGLLGILFAGHKLQRAYQIIKCQSDTDFLTGLANRRTAMNKLQDGVRVAQRTETTLALLMLDLDRFKDINDNFGHPAGDALLQAIAQRLKDNLREVDTIARLGGDEFALLLERVNDTQDAAHVANKLLGLFQQPWQLAGYLEVHLSASIGIALYPAHGDSAERLLEHADTALYRAKQEGRNRFHFFNEQLTIAATERIQLESELRYAINNNQLEIYFQPLVNIYNAETAGAEALLRWRHPHKGLLLPDAFLSVAEETGLIETIDQWVLTETCRQGHTWLNQGFHFQSIAVNISGYELHHSDFAAHVARILEQQDFPAHKLTLEFNERALMERELETYDMLTALSNMGIKLAIDDFGSDYSSLARLQQLPIEQLKIDRLFIARMVEGDKAAAFVQALLQLGHTLGYQMIAKGVESNEQLHFLQLHGCAYYQGFLTSPGVPAGTMQQWLKNTDPLAHNPLI